MLALVSVVVEVYVLVVRSAFVMMLCWVLVEVDVAVMVVMLVSVDVPPTFGAYVFCSVDVLSDIEDDLLVWPEFPEVEAPWGSGDCVTVTVILGGPDYPKISTCVKDIF